jgi:hypothetical protein
MDSFLYKLQKRNPLGICAFLPIDSRKIKVLNTPELKLKKRNKKLDLPYFFKTSCLHCISMFQTRKYTNFIPHFSEKHTEIEIIENAYFYKKCYQKKIKDLLLQKEDNKYIIKKYITKKIYVKPSNIIYVFYIALTIIVFTSLFFH